MKKLALLLFIGGMFASCNDGDLVFNELNFSGDVQKCLEKQIYYKLNSNEMLLLNMTGKFDNPNSLVLNQEYEIDASQNMILYRQYSDKAIAGSICNLIAPAYPQVVDEFGNTGGKVTYKRVRKIEQKENDPVVNINYAVSFNFHNMILTNGNSELKYENYNFGEISDSSSALNFNFNFMEEPIFCPNSDILFALGNQALKIIGSNIESEIPVGTQTVNLNDTTFLRFYFLDQSPNSNEFCDLIFTNPETVIKEEWTANQGTIEVIKNGYSTTENPDIIIGYTTTFVLKNATFTSDSDSFIIDEQIIYTKNIDL